MTQSQHPANDAPVLEATRLDKMVDVALSYVQEKPSNVIQIFRRPAVWGSGVAALAACLALLALPGTTTTQTDFTEPDISHIIMFDILADLT